MARITTKIIPTKIPKQSIFHLFVFLLKEKMFPDNILALVMPDTSTN
jgi:hypothetical protein